VRLLLIFTKVQVICVIPFFSGLPAYPLYYNKLFKYDLRRVICCEITDFFASWYIQLRSLYLTTHSSILPRRASEILRTYYIIFVKIPREINVSMAVSNLTAKVTIFLLSYVTS
jgi:hypothetical protein